eukprot:COSAG02_NODE_3005_length_7570_cov_3.554812_7_plen_47_part_00
MQTELGAELTHLFHAPDGGAPVLVHREPVVREDVPRGKVRLRTDEL